MTVPTFGVRSKSSTPKRDTVGTEEIKNIVNHIEKFDPIEDVKENGETQKNELRPEHLDAFDCAFKPFRGEHSIHYTTYLKMMAAAQPFINGAISKTVNLPKECTVEDIADAYIQAWKRDLNVLRFIVTDSVPSAHYQKQ